MPANPNSTIKPALELKRIAAVVLSDMAFMLGDDEPTDWAPGAIMLEGTIGYHGPVNGRLRCFCTRDFAVRLAANIRGIDPDDDEALAGAEDAVRELLNVLCGQLITAWHGTEAVFQLDIPAVREHFEAPAIPRVPAHCLARFSLNGEAFICTWQPGV